MILHANIPGLKLFLNAFDINVEETILKEIDTKTWNSSLQRKVQHYGFKYDYISGSREFDSLSATKADPFPKVINELSSYISNSYSLPNFNQCIVNEYFRSQGIGAHIDNLSFGDTVVSVTLNFGCNMIMTNIKTGKSYTLWLPRRSVLILQGDARYEFKHSIPKKATLEQNNYDGSNNIIKIKKPDDYRRVSVTYRFLQ